MNSSVRRHTKLKRLLFALIVALLFLPLLQHAFSIVKLEPLKGAYTSLTPTSFSVEGWLDGNYQDDNSIYLNQNFGFRSLFVRTYNQIYYSFFTHARAKSVIVGKDNYLYEKNYIKAYLGSDFLGNQAISENVSKLQKIRDTLLTKGVDLMIVFAPGKASFYPEFIPEEYNPTVRSTTNYEVYQEQLVLTDIHFLDMHSWFREMKDNSEYPLFPKTGIHWSNYGEWLAADSMVNYISSLSKDYTIPKIEFYDVETSDLMRYTDDDIEKGLNLLFDIEDFEMGYPQTKILKDSALTYPKVLTVADSYYWGLFNSGLSRDAFNNGQFWFYNEQIYPDSYLTPISVSDIQINEKVEENNVIIILSTDANLSKFGFGFIDQLYDSYYN